jgi:scyllo-inositol 2-dehydrogenase (NADP+)
MTTSPITVGISGYGRSGCDIHARAIAGLPGEFAVRAVFDPLEARRSNLPEGARGHDSFEALVADPAVELIVVASPNKYHAPQARAALEAGKHVLCEKPFGFTTRDVDAMIEASRKAGRVLQPFQQRRYEPDFRKVQEICQSGLLGRITYIRTAWHGFSRRWDWQTLRSYGGGQLYNNGPHPLDHALELFGPGEPEVWCDLRKSLASGDAEDEVMITLRGEGAPTIQIELRSTAAFPDDRWSVCGTAGGLRGDARELRWKWVDWSSMPERPVDERPTENRVYNRENLEWQEDKWSPSSAADSGAGAAPAQQPVRDLYRGLWAAIREGKPQEITPESARRRVAVLEACYRQRGIPFPEGALTN